MPLLPAAAARLAPSADAPGPAARLLRHVGQGVCARPPDRPDRRIASRPQPAVGPGRPGPAPTRCSPGQPLTCLASPISQYRGTTHYITYTPGPDSTQHFMAELAKLGIQMSSPKNITFLCRCALGQNARQPLGTAGRRRSALSRCSAWPPGSRAAAGAQAAPAPAPPFPCPHGPPALVPRRSPDTGSELSLKGMGAFDAAAYCASISAAKRRKSQCEGAGAVMHGADDKQQLGSPAAQRRRDAQQRQQRSDQQDATAQQQAGAAAAEPGISPARTTSGAAGAVDATASTTSSSTGRGRGRGGPSLRPSAAQQSKLLSATKVFFKRLAFWDKSDK